MNNAIARRCTITTLVTQLAKLAAKGIMMTSFRGAQKRLVTGGARQDTRNRIIRRQDAMGISALTLRHRREETRQIRDENAHLVATQFLPLVTKTIMPRSRQRGLACLPLTPVATGKQESVSASKATFMTRTQMLASSAAYMENLTLGVQARCMVARDNTKQHLTVLIAVS